MIKWAFTAGAAFILGGACTMQDDLSEFDCSETLTNCRVVNGFYGYQRACSTACVEQVVAPNRGTPRDDDDDDESSARGGDDGEGRGTEAESPPVTEAPSEASGENLGAASPLDLTRYSAFDIPCERDSQCGPGKCMAGNCYYGCHSDAQCGSGDRCSVETGARVCMPDPNPPVECTRSAQCQDGFTCLNGACRQSCTSTEQCTNVLDRCGSGVCLPDRRPLGECVLNSECAEGLVCLDGACVPACPADSGADGGVCLAEPTPIESTEGAEPQPARGATEPPGTPEEPTPGEAGEGEAEQTEEPSAEDTGEAGGDAADAGVPISDIR